MTATGSTASNSQTRKSLASQIDRLDGILDGLADGLNDAVALAVKEAVAVAVKEAVQTVLAEVLTNPEIAARLQASLVKNTPRPASRDVTWRDRLAKIRQKVTGCCMAIAKKCGAGLHRAWRAAVCLGRKAVQVPGKVVRRGAEVAAKIAANLWVVRQFKYQLLVALAVGAAAGVAAYFAGPWLSVLASGVGGFAASAAVQGALWLRRTLTFDLTAD